MSQYVRSIPETPLTFVFGWDPPLQTYFIQVHDMSQDEEEEIILWKGTTPYEIPTADILNKLVAEYKQKIPEYILIELRHDKKFNIA